VHSKNKKKPAVEKQEESRSGVGGLERGLDVLGQHWGTTGTGGGEGVAQTRSISGGWSRLGGNISPYWRNPVWLQWQERGRGGVIAISGSRQESEDGAC